DSPAGYGGPACGLRSTSPESCAAGRLVDVEIAGHADGAGGSAGVARAAGRDGARARQGLRAERTVSARRQIATDFDAAIVFAVDVIVALSDVVERAGGCKAFASGLLVGAKSLFPAL